MTFQTSLNKQGSPTEYANLTEDQATFLMMLFKPSPIVVKFRVQLVKAFRKALTELERLSKQKSEPAWQFIRDETKVGFKWMAENLKEQLESNGKKVDKLIEELKKFPPDSLAFGYDGEIVGLVILDSTENIHGYRYQLGYIPATEN